VSANRDNDPGGEAAHGARERCSPFGPEDQIGMLNHVTSAKRMQALSLVREGRLYDLGHVLDENVPTFPGRYFRQTLVTTAHHVNAMGSSAASDQTLSTGVGDCNVNWVATTAGPSPTSPRPGA